MSNYNGLTQFVELVQDYENSVAGNVLSRDPAELNKYTTDQKNRLSTAIFEQKADAFNKVFNDASQASDTANNIYYHYKRGKEALDANDKIYGMAKQNISTATYNSDLAKRQFEINEWAVQNKRDTLFVYQFIFITVLVLAILTGFWKYGMIPTGVYGLLIFTLMFVLACTIAYRALYTDQTRNKFYWNRRNFGRMGAPPVAPICPSITSLFNKIPNLSDLPSDSEIFEKLSGTPGATKDWMTKFLKGI
jgi:hypothetical protein